jgi:hypothetical protein
MSLSNISPPRRKFAHCSGLTLLETCSSLSISILVVTVALGGISRCTKWYQHLRQSLHSEQTFLEVQVIIERALSSLETDRSPHLWRIHKNGEFQFGDNTRHAISKINGTSQPRADSDGLSLLELAPEATATVTTATADEMVICPLMTPTSPLGQIHSFLHISAHGTEQRTTGGSPSGISWPESCGRIKGARLRSIFFASTTPYVTGQRAIPVTQEYSLFVDRSSRLRIVSHRGGWLRENQPLVDGLKSLRLSSATNSGVTIFTVRATSVHGRNRMWVRPLRIGRREANGNDFL